MRIAHGTLVLALLGATAYGADIYRSTAPDGTVSFSDRPQANSEYAGTSTPNQRPAEAPPPQRGAAATAAPPEAPAVPTLPGGATSQELREQRQKNCDIARERQERYTLSRRLFRTNAETGEREYLDDAASAQAKAKAAQDVQDWCD